MQAVKDGQRQGGALTIKHTAARKGKGPAGKAGPPGSDMERKVVNCLSCGKVFDFRLAGAGQLTNDLLRFLGQPTFHKSAILYCCRVEQKIFARLSSSGVTKPCMSRSCCTCASRICSRFASASLEMPSAYIVGTADILYFNLT